MRSFRSSAALAGLGLIMTAAPCRSQTRHPPVTVITGTLLGADGAPMKLAHVHVYPTFQPSKVARGFVNHDGSFAIAVAGEGAYRLQFTGVDHDNASFPIVLKGSARFALDVRLPHFAYTDTLDRVKAIGDWNQWTFGNPTPLVHQSDGRYTLTLPVTADTLAYQFVGLEARGGANRSINGPQADWYAYDNGGDYRSVLRVTGGHATIVLDPSQLDRRTETLTVRFRDPRSRAAQLYAMDREWGRLRQTYFDSSRAARARHDSLRYDWAPTVAGRVAALRRQRDPILRQVLLLELQDLAGMGATVPRAQAERIVREVPPSSPAWAAGMFFPPGMMVTAFRIAAGIPRGQRDSTSERAGLAYLDRFLSVQPDTELKVQALANAVFIARASKDDVHANDYFTRLVTDFPNSPTTAFIKSQLSPNRIWRDSAAVPDFRFASLDDTTVTYTPATFAGKICLLDFWATWCGPCIGDMPYLQAAHDSLASRGLEMLSISIDNSAEDVRKFRAGEWKMPWHHALMAGGMGTPEARRLEIMYVPRVVLVGRDGKIIAVDSGLRGEALVPTLRRVLEAPAAHASP